MMGLPRFPPRFPPRLPPTPLPTKKPENISSFAVVSANPVPDSRPGHRVLYKEFRSLERAIKELYRVKDYAEVTVLRVFPRKGEPYNLAGYIAGQEVSVDEADARVRKWLAIQDRELQQMFGKESSS